MKSENDVRTALVEFLTTLTSLLKTVTPLVEEGTREALAKFEPKSSRLKQQSRPVVKTYEDDEVPF